ncbi:unnamed protein product [Mytilus coruscus]|uniref:C-type lectin domain-containing protein n=1 Tax=Mytilus coruscus TaxID=42192 RepID=A0A6J8BYD0_MYTCO|nr:unnamed protein product [Mytilus coruscus]
MQITPLPAACASLCSIQETCCCASYDRKTKQCNLDESCWPDSEPSTDAMMLMKFADSLSCQNGWLRNENKCYFFSNDKKTWADAKIACEDDGGMLVEVDSKYENDYLKMKASKTSYWLGGTDIQNENVWIWSKSQNEFTFADWKRENQTMFMAIKIAFYCGIHSGLNGTCGMISGVIFQIDLSVKKR